MAQLTLKPLYSQNPADNLNLMFSFILSSICDVNLWAKTHAGQVICTKEPLPHCQTGFSSLFLKLVSYFSSLTPQEVSSGCVLCPALWLAPCRGPNLATQWADLFSKPPPAGRLYERPFKGTQKHGKVHLYAFIWNGEEKLDWPPCTESHLRCIKLMKSYGI